MDRQSGPFEEEEEIRIPVTDRRKVHVDHKGEATATAPSPDLPSEPEAPAETAEVQVVKDEAAGYLEDLQRLKAEFENYRKRMLKEQTAFAETASVLLISRLLGVVDAFSLAIRSAAESKDFDSMLKGVEMAFGEMTEVLEAEGLQKMEPLGEPFDPNVHEAAVEVPGDDSGVLIVEDVLRPGYTFKGRVLRPAMVKVTQRGEVQEKG